MVHAWSRSQPTVALSGAEAELAALTTGLAEALFLRHLVAEFGDDAQVNVYSDSAAARAIAQKSGAGPKAKHLAIKALCSQEVLN